jgi:hypothetical protein
MQVVDRQQKRPLPRHALDHRHEALDDPEAHVRRLDADSVRRHRPRDQLSELAGVGVARLGGQVERLNERTEGALSR